MEKQPGSAAATTSGEAALSPAQGKVWRKTQVNVAQLKSAIESLVEKTGHIIKSLPNVKNKQREVKMLTARLQKNLEMLRTITPGEEIPQVWDELAAVETIDIGGMGQELATVLSRLVETVPEMVIVEDNVLVAAIMALGLDEAAENAEATEPVGEGGD